MSKVLDGWMYTEDIVNRESPMKRNYFHIEIDFFTLPEPSMTEEDMKRIKRDEDFINFLKKLYGE